MNFYEEVVPNWSKYLDLSDNELLRLPGIQPILLFYGKKGLRGKVGTGITWTCCGIYSIPVNGGGLEAEIAYEPNIGYYTDPIPLYDPWKHIEKLASSLEEELVDSFVNPFSWDPLTPLYIEGVNRGPPGCIYDLELDRIIYSGSLPSLRAVKPTICSRVTGREVAGYTVLGFFKLGGRKWALSRGLSRISTGSCHGYSTSSSAVLWGDEDCTAEIITPYYDYIVSLLFPSSYYRFRFRGEILSLGPVPAVVIGLWTKIAVASRNGVRVRVMPGRLIVSSKRSLRIAVGGETIAYRIFLEDLLSYWRLVRVPEDGLGNARSSSGALMIIGGENNEMVLSMYNPLDSTGIGEVRLPAASSIAMIKGPLGAIDIPVDYDLVRLPLAPGFIGYAKMKLIKKGVFFRFRRSRKR